MFDPSAFVAAVEATGHTIGVSMVPVQSLYFDPMEGRPNDTKAMHRLRQTIASHSVNRAALVAYLMTQEETQP